MEYEYMVYGITKVLYGYVNKKINKFKSKLKSNP